MLVYGTHFQRLNMIIVMMYACVVGVECAGCGDGVLLLYGLYCMDIWLMLSFCQLAICVKSLSYQTDSRSLIFRGSVPLSMQTAHLLRLTVSYYNSEDKIPYLLVHI